MKRWPRVRALRPRLMLVVALGAAGMLAALTVGFNVVLDARLKGDLNDLLHQRAAAHLDVLGTAGGRLRLPAAPGRGALATPMWVFAGHKVLERPVARLADDRAALALAGGPRRTVEVGE